MLNIYLDIETIPDQRAGAYEAVLQSVQSDFKAPSSLTKEQAAADLGLTDADEIKFTGKASMIARWEQEMAAVKSADAADTEYRKTALNGGYGQVCVIGLAVGDGEISTLSGLDEAGLLNRFNQYLLSARENRPHREIRFVGHNIEWDLRFLFHRHIVNNIRPSVPLAYSRYSGNTADTMQMWAGYGNRIKLSELCGILNVPTPKDAMDGSQVWDYIRAGKIGEVAAYCAKDVAATREVYKRLTFQAVRKEAEHE